MIRCAAGAEGARCAQRAWRISLHLIRFSPFNLITKLITSCGAGVRPSLEGLPYFAGGGEFGKCSQFKLKKRPCARQQTESVNATHRVSPAGRRPPAAGKLAVGAARRIGGDERGGA